MSIGLWAQEAILLMCVFRDTRRIDFPRVDGLSTGPPVLGRHTTCYLFMAITSKLAHMAN